jgi:hypothetical protein
MHLVDFMKPKLKLIVGQATHFLQWELSYLKKKFELVDEPAEDVILYVFGPDVLKVSAGLPALRRVAMLFPGFAINPYHNVEQRREALEIIDANYDVVFVNPGPLSEAYKTSSKVVQCSFTINPKIARHKRHRKVVDSLLHVSADYPQKDWQRSAAVMEATGLQHEVFPPRSGTIRNSNVRRVKRRLNHYCKAIGMPALFHVLPVNYVEHSEVIKKYKRHDAFVHVAAETPGYVDGKYTACLIEAGATGAILFWHDTLGLGNELETVFNLPVDPITAAGEIMQIRKSINVEKHSRLTREEILDVYDAERSVNFRAGKIKELL